MISLPWIVPWCLGRETLVVVFIVRMVYHGARLVRSLGKHASEAMMASGLLSQLSLNLREALEKNKWASADISENGPGPFITALHRRGDCLKVERVCNCSAESRKSGAAS